MTDHVRYIVELRPPQRGERFVTAGITVLAECDYDDHPEDQRWVIVDKAPQAS